MEEFEKWASRQGFIVDKNENGDYKYLGVQNLWVCWQAAQHSMHLTGGTVAPVKDNPKSEWVALANTVLTASK